MAPKDTRLLQENRPDVALVDIGLPGIDGYEIARRVRAELADRSIRLVASPAMDVLKTEQQYQMQDLMIT